MGSIFLVNKYKHIPTAFDVPVHRGTPLGNPYTGTKELKNTSAKFQCASREEAIEKFQTYLLERIQSKDPVICKELNRIYTLAKNGEVNLVCFCAPKDCHGRIIKEIIESKF